MYYISHLFHNHMNYAQIITIYLRIMTEYRPRHKCSGTKAQLSTVQVVQWFGFMSHKGLQSVARLQLVNNT